MKIKVYKSENGLDVAEIYETTLSHLLYFLRSQRVPKPNERFIFLRRGFGPVVLWYEILEKQVNSENE